MENENSTWVNYDPAVINCYRILNQTYDSLTAVKIRLDGHRDPDTMTIDRGQYVDFVFHDGSLTYNGYVVQQVDFNDGASADDLSLPNYAGCPPGLIQYNSGDTAGNTYDVLDFNEHQFMDSFKDLDGINKGPAAVFNQYIPDDSPNIIVLGVNMGDLTV